MEARSENIFYDFVEADRLDPSHEEVLAACGGDPILAELVNGLLSDFRKAARFMPDPVPPPINLQISSYTILRQIGSGGMGTVYLAERKGEDFDQQVAIKILPHGKTSERDKERFLQERRVLARLEHPNIARLIDGGYTEDGRPFIAMEYVDGLPLDQFVKDHRLSVKARIDLFRQVLESVQYAHSRLIVHRDLKPSNIFVNVDGRVRLLDFGISKLLDDDIDQSVITGTGVRLMTPSYAAPEQVAGETVTIATDVYQLGVLLYELLSDSKPFDLRQLAYVEIEKEIRFTVPELPSKRVLAAQPEGASALASELRGDLDTIIMTALRKEPEKRYASVLQFLEDLDRHEQGLPIIARESTTWYRVGKFVNRNRIVVSFSALVFLLMVVFTGVTFVQSKATEVERDIAQAERDRAKRVVDFMVDLFEQARPETGVGKDITVREVLDLGVSQIQFDLTLDSDSRGDFLNVMGQTYEAIGDLGKAEALLKEGLKIRTASEGNLEDEAVTLNALAIILLKQYQPKLADSLLVLAEDLRIRSKSTELNLASINANRGAAHEAMGNLAKAESLYTVALPIMVAKLGPSHRQTMVAMNNLAMLKRKQGNREEAEALLRETLPARKQRTLSEPGAYALTLANLGVLLNGRNAHEEAEKALREALTLFTSIYDSTHGNVTSTLMALASSLSGQHRFPEAESAFNTVIRLRSSMYGPSSRQVTGPINNLASMWMRADRPELAEPFYQQAVEIAFLNPGPKSALYTQFRSNLAWSLLRQDHYAEAESIFRAAIEAKEMGVRVPKSSQSESLWGLSKTILGQNRDSSECLESVEAALILGMEAFSKSDTRPVRMEIDAARCLARRGQREEGSARLERAAQGLESLLGVNHSYMADLEEAARELALSGSQK